MRRDEKISAVSIMVRAAAPEDMEALVRLPLANADRHVRFDPAVHRIPDPEIVRRYFEGALLAGSDVLILAAETDGEVTGMTEVIILPDPPDHQILGLLRRAFRP